MTFEITYDGVRGKHITFNEKWNVIVKDKSMAEAYFRVVARKAGVFPLKIHSIEEVKE